MRGHMAIAWGIAVLAAITSGTFAPAAAHETEPARAEIRMTGDGGIAVSLTLDVEKYVTGVDPGHKSTMQGVAGDRYRALRKMAPTEMAAVIADEGFVTDGVRVTSAGGAAIPLEIATSIVPPVGNTRHARRSTITRKSVGEIAHVLNISFDRRLGDIILRVGPKLSGGTAQTVFLEAGEQFGPLQASAAGS